MALGHPHVPSLTRRVCRVALARRAQVNQVLTHLAKQDAKRKADKAACERKADKDACAKKAAADGETPAAARGEGPASAAQTSSARPLAVGGGARVSKYNFNGRNLSHLGFECNAKKKSAAADAPTADNSSAASDIQAYTTRGMNVAPLGGSIDKSEGAGERNRPRIERLAQRTTKATGGIATEEDMTEVALRVRKHVEVNRGFKSKWKVAARISQLYMSSHYAVNFSKGAPGDVRASRNAVG